MKLCKYMKVLAYNGHKIEGHLISPKLFDALVNSKIFFSHPASFNDPLECTIPITINNYEKISSEYIKFTKKSLKEIIGEDIGRMKRINEVIHFGIPLENCLIACLSAKENNDLMWSHYADQYNGICLCYEFPDTKEEFEDKISWSSEVLRMKDSGLKYSAHDVEYKKRPSLEFEDTNLPVEQWKFKNDYNIEDAIFIKPESWSYEQEWRIALMLPHNCKEGFAPGIDTCHFYMTIPKEWLKEIIFGFRLNDEYCQDIITILNENGYKNVSINKIQFSHGTAELSAVPYITTTEKF